MKHKNYFFPCCKWFQEQVFIVIKIPVTHPGSVKNLSGIPDPGGKNTGSRIKIRNTDHIYGNQLMTPFFAQGNYRKIFIFTLLVLLTNR
jgi:hypothetical protein